MTAICLGFRGAERAPTLLQPTLSITCGSGLQIRVYSGPLILPPGRLLTIYQPGLMFSAKTPFALKILQYTNLEFVLCIYIYNVLFKWCPSTNLPIEHCEM